jgi:hypothetical protein
MAAASQPASARGPSLSKEERRIFDEQQVEQADLACKASDHRAFFSLVVQSKVVRRKFTDETVEYAEVDAKGAGPTKQIAREAYDRFPIRMVDFQWKSAAPQKRGDADEYVLTEIDLSQTNRIAVEWTRVHYLAPFVGEEHLGTPYDLDGKRYDRGRPGHGTLLFVPRNGCWYLAADIRRTTR